MLPFRSIVCPTDFDDTSELAFKAAVELAQHFGSRLCLVHIVSDTPYLSYYPELALSVIPPAGSVLSPAEIEESLRASAQQHLDRLARCEVPSSVQVNCVVRCGDPVGEILHLIEQENADLLVLGTHGRTGWRRLFYGSIAEKEVRLAPCPVVVIHNALQDAATAENADMAERSPSLTAVEGAAVEHNAGEEVEVEEATKTGANLQFSSTSSFC